MPIFTAPTTGTDGDRFSFKDAAGHVVLIYVKSYETEINTSNGVRDAVRMNVVDLDTGQHYLDTLAFPKVIVGSLKSSIGKFVLGQVALGVAKPGQNAPWVLNDASQAPKAVAAAEAWLAANPGVLDDAPQITAPAGVSASALI
jgi:hypothetical protein